MNPYPQTYEEYLAYMETVQGIARYPLTMRQENPPDMLVEYRRLFTRQEWETYCENRASVQSAHR